MTSRVRQQWGLRASSEAVVMMAFPTVQQEKFTQVWGTWLSGSFTANKELKGRIWLEVCPQVSVTSVLSCISLPLYAASLLKVSIKEQRAPNGHVRFSEQQEVHPQHGRERTMGTGDLQNSSKNHTFTVLVPERWSPGSQWSA